MNETVGRNGGLPPGWAWAELGELANYINGRGFKKSEWSSSGRPIVRIQDLTGTTRRPNYFDGEVEDRHVVQPGDFLISWAATLGAFIWDGPEGVLNQHIFKVDSFIDKRYHHHLAQYLLDDLYRRAHGTGMVHITKGRFDQTKVRLAPLGEQRRIVEKIEELFSDLDAGVAALERVRTNLKRYRASVLKAAVEGRLTADWRKRRAKRSGGFSVGASGGEAGESGDELLKRILTERRRRWIDDQLAAWKRKQAEKGRDPASITKAESKQLEKIRAKYKPPVEPDTTNLPDLPDGWCWATVDMLIVEPLSNGLSVKGSNSPPGVAALKLSAMSDGGFDYTKIRYLPISAKIAATNAVNEGDFFVSRGNGSLSLVVRGTLAQKPPFVVVYPDTMIRLRITSVVAATKWLSTLWPSWFVRRQIERRVKTTAGIYKISQPDLASVAIPLPPEREQKVIITAIEQRVSITDDTQQVVASTTSRAAKLRQSILKRAFAGKLVAQDLAEESAETLLAHIRKQREDEQDRAKKAKRKRRGRPAATHPDPNQIADVQGGRLLISAYIVVALYKRRAFGRTQLLKALYLAQNFLEIPLALRFQQGRRGPFTRAIYEIEAQARDEALFRKEDRPSRGVRYRPGSALMEKRGEAVRVLGKKKDNLDRLLRLFLGMDTDEAELFATVYAVWNDLLIDGKPADDDAIIRGVYAWDESKRRFTRRDIRRRLEWMKTEAVVPHGRGAKIVPKEATLFDPDCDESESLRS